MIKNIFIVFFLFCFSLQATIQEQLAFSTFELEMDKIANTPGADTSEILDKMDALLKSSADATPAERALFLTYDCSLRAGLASTLAEDRFKDLQELSAQYSSNASVRAATALCEANIATFHKDSASYQQSLFKAYKFTQQADLATLKYWVSLNVHSVFEKYSDHQNSEKALLLGLKVAEDNNDQFRLSTANQLLAETYLATKDYKKALKHNDAAQTAMDQTTDKWYQGEIYNNRARILTGLHQLDKAMAFYQQALEVTKQHNNHREVQFILLDIAYLHILQQNNAAAKSLINNVSQYGLEYDDLYLNNNALIIKSLLSLSHNNLSLSEQEFKQATKYFVKNDFNEIIITAWGKQAAIASIYKQYQVSEEASKQYFTLLQKKLVRQSLAIQTLVVDSYEKTRLDDAEIAKQQLEKATAQKDQLSKNSQMLFTSVVLLGALLFIILIKFAWRLSRKRKLKKEEINRQLYYDPLTQCFNRRYFDEIICQNLIEQSLANKVSYLVVMDIDHFKSFNDTYGHSAGDIVLKELVKNLQSDSRFNDSVVRMGGEEFLLTLPPNENLRVEVVIERILSLVSHSPVVIEDKPRNISISIGYVPIEKATNKADIDDLMNLADKALYVAKETGRNRAIGVNNLQCPANYIDKILIANENKLLTLKEVKPKGIGA